MPVRVRSRASICAMYCRPFWLRSRSSSSSALKPARMVPPSVRFTGGSSAMASRIRSRTSGTSSRRVADVAQASRTAASRSSCLQLRDLFERSAERQQIARAGASRA